MQSLEIISINLWQVLISLGNLVILFLLLKKFLYKPVQKVLKERQNSVDETYKKADEAEKKATENKELWENKLISVKDEADAILQTATENAERRSQTIVEAGEKEAERIRLQAEADAVLERKKAESEIKEKIVDVSVELSSKMLEREITPDDHQNLIDKFIAEIGEEDDENR